MSADIDAELNAYRRSMETQNLSPDTIKNYYNSARRFLLFCGKTSDHLTREDIIDYVIHLKKKGGEKNSLKQELIRVRNYLSKKELTYKEGSRTKSLHMLIELPRDAKARIRQPYTDKEVQKLFDAVPLVFSDPFLRARTKAILSIMFRIPIRRKEITLLEREGDEGLDIDRRTLFVHRVKRGENWHYPLSDQVFDYVLDYLRLRGNLRPGEKLSRWLFVDQDEEQMTPDRVSEDYAACARKVGVGTGTHLSRHTTLTNAAKVVRDNHPLKHLAGDRHTVSVDEYLRTINGKKDIEETYRRLEKTKQER